MDQPRFLPYRSQLSQVDNRINVANSRKHLFYWLITKLPLSVTTTIRVRIPSRRKKFTFDIIFLILVFFGDNNYFLNLERFVFFLGDVFLKIPTNWNFFDVSLVFYMLFKISWKFLPLSIFFQLFSAYFFFQPNQLFGAESDEIHAKVYFRKICFCRDETASFVFWVYNPLPHFAFSSTSNLLPREPSY